MNQLVKFNNSLATLPPRKQAEQDIVSPLDPFALIRIHPIHHNTFTNVCLQSYQLVISIIWSRSNVRIMETVYTRDGKAICLQQIDQINERSKVSSMIIVQVCFVYVYQFRFVWILTLITVEVKSISVQGSKFKYGCISCVDHVINPHYHL